MTTIKAVAAVAHQTSADEAADKIRERIDQDTIGWIESIVRDAGPNGPKAALGDVERAMFRRRALHRSVDWLRNYLA